MNKIILKIEGMHCDGCCKRIENVLKKVDGVVDVSVSLDKKEAEIETNKELDKKILINKIESLDFKVVND